MPDLVSLLSAHLSGEHRNRPDVDCTACQRVGGEAAPEKPRVTGDGLCECGCGEPVKARFRPGHDAKLKSRLIHQARRVSGSKEDLDAVNAAKDELERRGWLKFL